MSLNQTAFRDGTLGVLGSLPPAYARRDGVLGALPPAHASRSGILGVLGAPPISGSYRSGSLGTPPVSGSVKSGVFGSLPPAHSFRSGSLGEYFAQNGLGDATPMDTMKFALVGLGVVAAGWWYFGRRSRG